MIRCRPDFNVTVRPDWSGPGGVRCLSAADCLSYSKVKSAILKSYELVPEAYQPKFRSWEKGSKQTNVEFALNLLCH